MNPISGTISADRGKTARHATEAAAQKLARPTAWNNWGRPSRSRSPRSSPLCRRPFRSSQDAADDRPAEAEQQQDSQRLVVVDTQETEGEQTHESQQREQRRGDCVGLVPQPRSLAQSLMRAQRMVLCTSRPSSSVPAGGRSVRCVSVSSKKRCASVPLCPRILVAHAVVHEVRLLLVHRERAEGSCRSSGPSPAPRRPSAGRRRTASDRAASGARTCVPTART